MRRVGENLFWLSFYILSCMLCMPPSLLPPADRILRLISDRCARPTPRLEGGRRAVVACILRRGSTKSSGDESGDDSGGTLEALFILRTGGKGSGRWGGQVAFPGGHVEAGETDEGAVMRECEEELGVHIARKGAYRLLGEVKQRRVVAPKARANRASSSSHSDSLVVCCLVYEQLAPHDNSSNSSNSSSSSSSSIPPLPPLRLQEREVAAAFWAPLSALVDDSLVRRLYAPEYVCRPINLLLRVESLLLDSKLYAPEYVCRPLSITTWAVRVESPLLRGVHTR